MPLNPAVEMLLKAMAEAPAIDFETTTVAAARAIFDTPMVFGPPPEVASVKNIEIALPGRTLAARLYMPENASANCGLTLYFHGGGWVIGTLETHDPLCRQLARESGHAVLSVDYRLAPEHRYPAAAEDCYDATCWAVKNAEALGLSSKRVAVAGDSAGGNLAGAVALMARDRGGPVIAHQLLIYPVTDTNFDRASYTANGGGDYYLSTAAMQWFWNHYLGDQPASAAPHAVLMDQASLADLPPATVITAQYDPLCDEGDAYAKRLAEAGVRVDYGCAPGMVHGFFSLFQVIPDSVPWIKRAASNLARDLGA
jgi:acetyl esterase